MLASYLRWRAYLAVVAWQAAEKLSALKGTAFRPLKGTAFRPYVTTVE